MCSQGGGVIITGSSAVVSFTDCDIYSNTASGDVRLAQPHSMDPMKSCALQKRSPHAPQGGGVYCSSGTLFLTDTTFISNTAASDVGTALYIDPADDNSLFTNVTFLGHTGVVIRNTGTVQWVCPLGYYMPWSGD